MTTAAPVGNEAVMDETTLEYLNRLVEGMLHPRYPRGLPHFRPIHDRWWLTFIEGELSRGDDPSVCHIRVDDDQKHVAYADIMTGRYHAGHRVFGDAVSWVSVHGNDDGWWIVIHEPGYRAGDDGPAALISRLYRTEQDALADYQRLRETDPRVL